MGGVLRLEKEALEIGSLDQSEVSLLFMIQKYILEIRECREHLQNMIPFNQVSKSGRAAHGML